MTSKVVSAYFRALAKRRAAKMTPEQRREHARRMALARWAKTKEKKLC